MLTPGHDGKYWIYTEPVDMRSGCHGLTGIISTVMKTDPLNGNGYIFFNKPRRIIKILFWDRDGYVIYAKWLAKGSFEKIIQQGSNHSYSVNYARLMMLLSGITIKDIRQRKRYTIQPS